MCKTSVKNTEHADRAGEQLRLMGRSCHGTERLCARLLRHSANLLQWLPRDVHIPSREQLLFVTIQSAEFVGWQGTNDSLSSNLATVLYTCNCFCISLRFASHVQFASTCGPSTYASHGTFNFAISLTSMTAACKPSGCRYS